MSDITVYYIFRENCDDKILICVELIFEAHYLQDLH